VESKSKCTRNYSIYRFEQLKSEMAIKTWENNLKESKSLAKEAKVACLNFLLVVDVEMDEIDLGDIHSIIGTLNVNEKREELKKSIEKDKSNIQQMTQVNLQILNHFPVKHNLKYQITQQVAVRVQNNLPLVHRKDFNFELNVNIDPPRFIVALMNFRTQYKDQQKVVAYTSKNEKIILQASSKL